MAERNDMTAALVTAYTSPQLAAINEYLEAEKAVRAAAEILGLDADLMIAEAEGLARATTFSTTQRRPPPGSRPRISLPRNTPAATSATWSRPASTARRRPH